MEQLTRAEEQVMQVLWKLERAFVKDVLAALPKPRPAITTVSTIIRILEQKGFVGHEAFGKSHRYHALVKKPAYSKRQMDKVVKDYFDGSLHGLVSFFMEKNDLEAKEVDDILKLLKAHKKQ